MLVFVESESHDFWLSLAKQHEKLLVKTRSLID